MRPCKPRRIGALPPCRRYVPQDGPAAEGERRIGLDMLEALRLVDAEGLPQDEAAAVMDVSAATLCRILSEARHQVAAALSQGRAISIEGGSVMVCERMLPGRRHGHGPHGRRGALPQAGVYGGNGQECGGAGRGRRNGAPTAAGEERGRRGPGRRGAGQGRCNRAAAQQPSDDGTETGDGAA